MIQESKVQGSLCGMRVGVGLKKTFFFQPCFCIERKAPWNCIPIWWNQDHLRNYVHRSSELIAFKFNKKICLSMYSDLYTSVSGLFFVQKNQCRISSSMSSMIFSFFRKTILLYNYLVNQKISLDRRKTLKFVSIQIAKAYYKNLNLNNNSPEICN